MQAFGYFPKRDEQIELNGIDFKVTSANSRQLIQLRVTLSDEQLEKMEKPLLTKKNNIVSFNQGTFRRASFI